MTTARRVVVRVPATSANLGPGFDALGLALALYDEVEAELFTPEEGGPAVAVTVEGEGAGELDLGERHLIVATMRETFERMGAPRPAGIRLRCRNAIPQARGLGSSSAAIVAGILAARALAGRVPPAGPVAGGAPLVPPVYGTPSGEGVQSVAYGGTFTDEPVENGDTRASVFGAERTPPLFSIAPQSTPPVAPRTASPPDFPGASRGDEAFTDDEVFALAAELEGHPDNVAPCLAGGLTIAWTDQAGTARKVKLALDGGIRPVVLVPSFRLSTEAARGLLPKEVSHRDAAFTAGRAALLVAALTRRPESSLLLSATEDRLHQDYRAPAMRRTADLVELLRARGVPAVVSGAGPTILAFATAETQDSIAPEVGNDWHIQHLDVAPDGASVQFPETR